MAAAALAMWVAAKTTAAVTAEARVMAAAIAERAMVFGEVGFLPHGCDNQPAC